MENSFWTSDRRFKRVELFLHCCLLVSCVKSQTAHNLRPRNVSITFGNDFCLTATWDPPEGIDGIEGCKREDLEYEYCTIPCPKSEEVRRFETVSETIHPMIEGGTLGFSVQTICNEEPRGEPVVVNIATNPKLLHDLQCVLYSSTDANCSWTPSSYSHVPDLRLFYWISLRTGSRSPDCVPLNLKECVISPHPDNVKRVCHISEDHLYNKEVYFLFNGTQDNMSVRNTFNMRLFDNHKAKFRLPALNWTLVRDGDNLIISWTPPEILKHRWKYLINYTQCNEKKNKSIEDSGVTLELLLPFDPRCQYRIKLKAIMSDGTDGETPWSDEKVHGENVSPDNRMITTALIALLLATTILCLTFCAVRKYKEQLFPRIPEPKDFLKEMLDNNNKCPAEKLYVPVEDTEDTRICLVLEPGVTKLDAVNP